MAQLVTILLGAVTLTLAFLVWRFFTEARALRTRYSGIADLEADLMEMKKRVDQTKREQQEFDSENHTRRVKLNQEYEQALTTYKELKREVSLLEENLEDISFGVYNPHFNFQSSDEYKTALENLRGGNGS